VTQPITRLDDITVAPGCRREFLDLLESRYLTAARERGLELVARHVSPPVDEAGFETNVLLSWQMADVATFWRARRQSITDPRVTKFWSDAAHLIVRRTRRFATRGDAEDHAVERGTPLPRAGRTSYILLVNAPKSAAWARRAAASLPDGVDSRLGRHLPGSISDADVSWEVGVPDGTRIFVNDVRSSVAALDDVELLDLIVLGKVIGGGVRAPELTNAIKRTLLLSVEPGTAATDVEAFERGLLGMPHHIAAIRNWRLSRVARSDGGHHWTHAWEQEYESLPGLQDDYMNSPYHWGFVDGWFDAEDPKCIVAPDLFHIYYEIESSILTCGTAA
jgi:hypothetical protein